MRTSRTVLAAAVAISACLWASPSMAALHPGDRVDVLVYNHPELSVSRTLDAAGNVSLPVAGTVAARNVEANELAERIRARLSPYVRNAAVQVQLATQADSIFVAGGPNGVLHYMPGETLSNVITQLQVTTHNPALDLANTQRVAQADVVNNTAADLSNGPIDFHRVGVLRDGRTLGQFDVLALRAAGETGPTLAPNDTIQLVNKPIVVHVFGDVEQPGTAYLDPTEPLAQALNQVGGAALTSSQTALQLYRNGAASTVSIGSPAFAEPAQNGDRLTVPRAPRVDVIGNVEKPGETILRGNQTLVSAIYYAGGPAKYANLKAVTLVRGGERTQYNLNNLRKGGLGDNPPLRDGDVVLVPQGSTFEFQDLWSGLGALGLFGLRI